MVTVQVFLSAKDFSAFAIFDVFIRLRRWIPLCAFVVLMSFFALICFMLDGVVTGCLLLFIGWGLPLVYVWRFRLSIRRQVTRLSLKQARAVYTLNLSQKGVAATPCEQKPTGFVAYTPWETVYRVFKTNKAVYLYVSKTKAYLIPNQCIADAEQFWGVLSAGLASEKIIAGCTRQKHM